MEKRLDSRFGSGGGGGGGKDRKYSVFDFTETEMQAEIDEQKSLAKFGVGGPKKKSASSWRPVDKYTFLQCFAQSRVTPQNHISENSPIDVNGSECNSRGAKSPAQVRKGARGYPTGRNHSNALCLDSDNDAPVLRSSVSFNLLDNEGSSREQSSDCGECPMNIDEAVAVEPIYVKYQSKYYTACRLTFSQRLISLEGSPLCDPTAPFHVELPDFDILKFECQQCESVRADVVILCLKSKCVNAAKAGNPNSVELDDEDRSFPCHRAYHDAGFAELEFVVLNDPHWLDKQEEIKSLDVQYQAAWKIITSAFSLNEPFEDIIYPEGDPDAVFIRKDDVKRLRPRSFISDTLVDFYMKYLLTKIKPEEQHRFHFFNTFFFRKLVDVDQDPHNTLDKREAFQRVRKWTRNVKIFEKDYIFVPINHSLHWSLIVICHPGEAANSSDNSNNSAKVPCILHMDSISGSHQGLVKFIKSYIWEECKALWSKHDERSEMEVLNLDVVAPQVPQQDNQFDCGLFLLHYAELFLERTSNISIAPCFDFLNNDWFHPAEVSLKKRDQIRNLIYTIAKNKAQKCPPSSGDDKYPHNIINKGDCSAQSVQEIGERKIERASPESCQHHEQQPLPINEFSNMGLPVENESESHNTFPPQDTVIRNVSEEDNKPASPSCLPSHGRMELPRRCSETLIRSPITRCVLNQERCVLNQEQYSIPEAEGEKERDEILLTSSDEDENVLTCVVEDSEDEESSRNERSSFHCRPHPNPAHP